MLFQENHPGLAVCALTLTFGRGPLGSSQPPGQKNETLTRCFTIAP